MIYFLNANIHCHISWTFFPWHTSEMSHWHVMVLTLLRYSRSLLTIKIEFKVQNRVKELLTALVKWTPGLLI